MKWTPDAIGSLVIIIAGLTMMFLGIDGEIKSLVAMSAGWLFGGQYQIRRTTINKKAS